MNAERRLLLKAVTLGSLAGVAGAHAGLAFSGEAAPVSSAPAAPTLALISDSVRGEGFLQGIAASPRARQVKAQQAGFGIDFILDLERRLRSGQPQHLIGLVDDASGMLIVDIARGAGATVQWLGEHSVTARHATHRLLSAEVAAGSAAQLERALNSSAAGFAAIDHRSLDGARRVAATSVADASRARDWTANLGYLLASLGAADSSVMPPIVSRSAPLTGNFVSFSIQA